MIPSAEVCNIFSFSSTYHYSFLFRCNSKLSTDILAGCSFNKRVCECLFPANHPSRNVAIALSNIDVAKNAHEQHRTKKLTYQRWIAPSISWTRQEPRGLVGSSVNSDQAVPGSNSTAVSSVFLCHFFFQSEDSEKFLSFSHVRRWPPHMRTTVRLLQEVTKRITNLPGGCYRDLQTSGQSMCSNGRLAIETSIKNLYI